MSRKLLRTVSAAVLAAALANSSAADTVARSRALGRGRLAVTAYCQGKTTASGVLVRTGIAAADPRVLPVGSVVQLEGLGPKYSGIYSVMDTGAAVKGRHVDIYVKDCDEATAFGRRTGQLTILRHGWDPKTSAPPERP